MPIAYEAPTLKKLLGMHDMQELVLPAFQRGFVWPADDQAQLLASIMSGFPVGSLLLLRGRPNDFAARSLGRMSNCEPAPDCSFLLDGQQRMSALYHFFTDPFSGSDWKDVARDTYASVRARWFLKVAPDHSSEDYFGYRLLRFSGLNCEPDDLRPYLTRSQVFLSRTSIGHPQDYLDLVAQRENPNLARLDFANQLADQGLVPLWELYRHGTDQASLHVRVLRELGRRRRAELAELAPQDAEFEALLTILKDRRPELEVEFDDAEAAAPVIREELFQLAADWQSSITNFLIGILERDLPIVQLPAEELHRAIGIFEIMNKGGTPLSTFDLVVAKEARFNDHEAEGVPNPGLTARLCAALSDMQFEIAGNPWKVSDFEFCIEKEQLTQSFKDAFLQNLAISVRIRDHGVGSVDVKHMKQREILSLRHDQIATGAIPSAEGVARAWAFLNSRCGITAPGELRNKLLILPIAGVLSTADMASDDRVLARLEFWYWCTVFSGTYRERQNDFAVNDLKALYSWIVDRGENPFEARRRRVLGVDGYSDINCLLRQDAEEAAVVSDVGRYLPQYVLSRTPLDLSVDGTPQQPLRADDPTAELELHHLLPLRTAATVGAASASIRGKKDFVLNSPLNYSYISKRANRLLRDTPIATYNSWLSQGQLASHFLPQAPGAFAIQNGEEGEAGHDRYARYYRRILRERFSLLQNALTNELNELLAR